MCRNEHDAHRSLSMSKANAVSPVITRKRRGPMASYRQWRAVSLLKLLALAVVVAAVYSLIK